MSEKKVNKEYRLDRLEYGGLLGIPKFIANRRKKLGFTQAELAYKCYMSKRAIEHSESVKSFSNGRGPTLIAFLRILRALRIKIRFVDADTGRDLNGTYTGKTAEQIEKILDEQEAESRKE